MKNEKNYTYEILENGYYIFIDGVKTMHQYEPFIPDKTKSYEENAILQIEELKRNDIEASKPHLTLEDRVRNIELALAESYEREVANNG